MSVKWMRHAVFQAKRKYDEETCPGILVVVSKGDVIWEIACDTCEYTAGLPAKQADPKLQAAWLLQQAEFPAMFADREFETTAANEPVKESIKRWLATYRDRPIPAPAIYGQAGRGKSHLLVATCRQLIVRHNVSVWYRPAAGLLDRLMSAFEQRGEHAKIWDLATTVDVLALDDLGAEQATEWKQERLARIVDERYQNNLPILVATNFRPEMWEEMIGARTVSRLLGMTAPIELAGDDRRLVQDREMAA